jgi:hypothetical protein
MASVPISSNPSLPAAGASGSRHENGPAAQSALQELTAECDRLRKDLAEARDELSRLRCHAEMLRQEWFTAKLQEEEYRKYICKLTGDDPYISPQEILEAEKSGLTMAQLLAEMEREAASNAGEG